MTVQSRPGPHLFDQAVTGGTKCVINRYGEANCNHVHASELPSQNADGWCGEGEDLVPTGWTAQHTSRDPRLGQQLFECSLCQETMTLEETTNHVCETP